MFSGFTPETVDFLWGIRMNNNREWFLSNKQHYNDFLYCPMKEMGQALFQPFADKPGNLLKVSRIYRDARMHHPLPYKESLWICIRKDVEWWAENPCLFFEINPEGVDYGFFYWKPPVTSLENFRREISAHPQKFLKMIRDAEAATGIDITAETYKRPKPTENEALAPYFAWKNAISCIRHEDFGEATFGPELAIRVRTMFEQLIPLYDFFDKFRV